MIHFRSLLIIAVLLAAALSCKDPLSDNYFSMPDWTARSHGNETAPNYEMVFPQNQVNKLEIRMLSSNWDSIKTDMKEKFEIDFGEWKDINPFEPPTGYPPLDSILDPGPIPDPPDFPDLYPGDPIYVAVSLKFNGKEWYKVGFRLKGNSTLISSWGAGKYKLPFRLNFDEFEDHYPQIRNQRFYGFKELSMSPAATDNSLIREKVAADIFREAGIPAARTAFYQVFIDFGEGLKYCGVYTMVEVIDDTMVKNQFKDGKGNIYKPESTFEEFDQNEFEKKNNKEKNDYSDVQAAIAALHNTNRTTNPALWREQLEESFNVDHFLRWLAVNTTMVNWDSYGTMAHNYYLYNAPGKGLTWIPWDHNEALARIEKDLSLSEVSAKWPLIRYLIDDPVYQTQYKRYVKEFAENVFTPAKMDALFEANHTMISPYVIGPQQTEQKDYSHLSSAAAFQSELTNLKQHVVKRNQAVQEYLK